MIKKDTTQKDAETDNDLMMDMEIIRTAAREAAIREFKK